MYFFICLVFYKNKIKKIHKQIISFSDVTVFSINFLVINTTKIMFFFKFAKLLYPYSCIEKEHTLEGRLPLVCYGTKEKKDIFNSDCCQEDFCNTNILPAPG